jgi:GNAT superfamily N-acetyltransferase
MPFELRPITSSDTLSWVRIRALAYYGPTHEVLHSGAVTDSSTRAIAQDWKRDLLKPNTWSWRIVDTDLSPSADDPPDNGGRTIAVAVWSMHNVKSSEATATPPTATTEEKEIHKPFTPPELRVDALMSLLGPLRAAQPEIMTTSDPYLMLNMFATHPEHQGRGASKMLLDWGLKKADDEGLVTYLNATDVGRRIYEKKGFKVVKAIEWDRVPWGGEGKDCHWCMVRQPRAKTE